MNVDSAVRLVNNLIYKPGWTLCAENYTDRFEGSIKLTVSYSAPDYGSTANPATWETGYKTWIEAVARFIITVGDCPDDLSVYRKVLDTIGSIDSHERREALRVRPSGCAPFHPHTIDGMQRWGTPGHDLTFGLALYPSSAPRGYPHG